MKLGAEPKKVAILVGLVVVAIVVYFMNSSSTGEGSQSNRPAAARPAPTGPNQPAAANTPATQPRTAAGRTDREFRPSLKPRRGEAAPDPTTIDPTLRLDILAKLQQQYPGKVLLVTRDFPLETECNTANVGHLAACEAAVAVRLAREKGKAREMEEWLFANQDTMTPRFQVGTAATTCPGSRSCRASARRNAP